MFYHFNRISLQLFHNIISLVNMSIILLKEDILHTKRKHLINKRKKTPSQEPDIPGLIDILSNRNQRGFSLTPKAPSYHK